MFVASIIAAALALPLNGNFTVSKAEIGKTDPAYLNDYDLNSPQDCSQCTHAGYDRCNYWPVRAQTFKHS